MIDVEFLDRLIRMVDESGLDSLEIERGGTRIRLAKTPEFAVAAPMVSQSPPQIVAAPAGVPAVVEGAGPPAPDAPTEAAPAASHLIDVPSPMVGTFYRAPAPDAPSYVDVGSSVVPGETLCIIEAMKLMNELECEQAGRIAEICIENGEPVEYGQLLFRIDPS